MPPVRKKFPRKRVANMLTVNRRVLRVDPTRTGTLRRQLVRELRRRFARLKLKVVDLLLKEDAFGLQAAQRVRAGFGQAARGLLVGVGKPRAPVANAFCPTGEGGGVDPSCSPGGTGSPSGRDGLPGAVAALPRVAGRDADTRDHGFPVDLDAPYRGVNDALDTAPVTSVRVSDLTATQAGVSISTLERKIHAGGPSGKPVLVVRAGGKHYLHDGTHEATLARLSGLERIPAKIVEYPLTRNNLTANDRWRFRTDPEKIAEFQQWLKETIGRDLLGEDTERLWTEYVRRGYAKGAGRAYDDFIARHPEVGGQPLDFYRGTREGFLKSSFGRPESVEKVKLLAGRAMDDLEGVTSEMSTRMVRHLTDGLVRGEGPKEIARALADDIDGIGRTRAETIARTEIIRVHAESQLDALESLGVEEVGVMVEWSTAQDEAVCELCAPLEGVVLRIDEARGMLPRHPNCRCAFLPANVAEDKEDQQRGQKTVEKAIRRSQEEGDDDFGPGVPISKERPRSVLNAVDRFSAAFNRFCPTGEGGGVDPTCGEGEGYPDEFRAPKKEKAESLKLAEAKVASAPKPSAEDVKKAREELEAARKGEGRAGGESRGGSAASRRKQRENLFNEFGGAEKGYVVCPWTGLKMHYTDDPKLNPKGYPKFERGKIFVKCQGGGYQLRNLIPESFAANRTRNDKRLRKENSKGC